MASVAIVRARERDRASRDHRAADADDVFFRSALLQQKLLLLLPASSFGRFLSGTSP